MKRAATLDSSFWINAHRAGLLTMVREEFHLHYAPAVATELKQTFASGREFWRLAGEGVLVEVAVESDPIQEFGAGERAAISVALEHPDWILLLDDQRPFRVAVNLGLKAVCTPILVVSLFLEGKFNSTEALTALARLAMLQTVSPMLLTAALTQLGKALQAREAP